MQTCNKDNEEKKKSGTRGRKKNRGTQEGGPRNVDNRTKGTTFVPYSIALRAEKRIYYTHFPTYQTLNRDTGDDKIKGDGGEIRNGRQLSGVRWNLKMMGVARKIKTPSRKKPS